MTHTDPKIGGWSKGEPMQPEEANLIREGVVNSLDIRGGTYTLTSPIIVNGGNQLQLGDQLAYTSRAVAKRWLPGNAFYATANWDWHPTFYVYQTTSTTSDFVVCPLDGIPHGLVLDGVSAIYQGATGHAGAPATLPRLRIRRRLYNDTTLADLGSTTDTYGSAGAFQAPHVITVGSLAHTIDKLNYVYFAEVRSEGGANAVLGAFFTALSVTCTITKQSEWEP